MITFYKKESLIIFSYTADRNGDDLWMIRELKKNGKVSCCKTFHFTKDQLHGKNIEDYNFDEDFWDPVEFVFGEIENGYIRVGKGILIDDHDIYFSEDIDLDRKYFVTHYNISIFRNIYKFVKEDIYIGGESEQAISLAVFEELLWKFPNTYERMRYVDSRITAVLRQYFDGIEDKQEQYMKYLNKKGSLVERSLLKDVFRDQEVGKYRAMYNRMEKMLAEESAYDERQWQKQILDILLLLFPKYIDVFREGPTKATKDRFVDFLLVDAGGNIDLIEIKRPNGNHIITKNEYRNNYIPLRELSGTIMQLEKYIYNLNRWGEEGETKLMEKYGDKLPEGFEFNITNPGGMIIMGRDKGLSKEQKKDFEVVKRKYKNVIDIITYDDLLRRLDFMVKRWEKGNYLSINDL